VAAPRLQTLAGNIAPPPLLPAYGKPPAAVLASGAVDAPAASPVVRRARSCESASLVTRAAIDRERARVRNGRAREFEREDAT
jgi:hypothetical protein